MDTRLDNGQMQRNQLARISFLKCLFLQEVQYKCAPSSRLRGFPGCSEASREPPAAPGSSQCSAKNIAIVLDVQKQDDQVV